MSETNPSLMPTTRDLPKSTLSESEAAELKELISKPRSVLDNELSLRVNELLAREAGLSVEDAKEYARLKMFANYEADSPEKDEFIKWQHRLMVEKKTTRHD